MKILMFAHNGSLNRGCEAIVRSSTSLFKETIDDAKVYLASGKPDTDKGLIKLDAIFDGSLCDIIKYSPQWLISSINLKLFKNESYALREIHKNTIRHIKDVDVCLSIGGDNYCYGEQPGWYEINRQVKAQGKKLVLWGCSIGEEDMSERKILDLKSFDLILARETFTYNMLKSKGFTNVKLCADPAFTMEKEELPLPNGWKEGKTIGLNFSPLVMKKNTNSKSAIRSLIIHILKSTDLTIALTPHVTEPENNDYEILNEFYQEYKNSKRVILLPNDLNAIQYKGYIARMRFFIGARTHATIAAYSSYIPTLVLGYSVKSKGISNDIFGEEKLVLGIEELSDTKKIIGKFKEMLYEEDELKKILYRSIPKVKKLSNKSVEYLNELVQ